jgi:hypothetical protein
MIDPAVVTAAVHLSSYAQGLGGIATFIVVLVLPAAWFFHRKVIRPLSWMLGLKAEESPTGEEILPIPQQLVVMRKNQDEVKGNLVKLTAEMHPNGGGSMRDSIDRNERLTAATQLRVINLEGVMARHAETDELVWTGITKSLIGLATGQKDAKQTAEDVAALTVETAAEVKATAEHTAADVASLAVDTATELAQDT